MLKPDNTSHFRLLTIALVIITVTSELPNSTVIILIQNVIENDSFPTMWAGNKFVKLCDKMC